MGKLLKSPFFKQLKLRLRRPVQVLLAPIAGNYISFVLKSSTTIADPPNYIERAKQQHPQIIAIWHGQFFLLPGIYPRSIPGRAMVSRHADTEALARVLRRFGLELIRGAGAGTRKRDRGGAEAAHGAVASLREDYSIAMTADVPPGPARKCGMGIVTIASLSGCPIVPFATATSRYFAVKSWDRMTINLPFSKIGIAMGEPIHVPADADRQELERCRQQVEDALNEVTARAYAIAGADPARATPPSPYPARS